MIPTSPGPLAGSGYFYTNSIAAITTFCYLMLTCATRTLCARATLDPSPNAFNHILPLSGARLVSQSLVVIKTSPLKRQRVAAALLACSLLISSMISFPDLQICLTACPLGRELHHHSVCLGHMLLLECSFIARQRTTGDLYGGRWARAVVSKPVS